MKSLKYTVKEQKANNYFISRTRVAPLFNYAPWHEKIWRSGGVVLGISNLHQVEVNIRFTPEKECQVVHG
jgi:hypothetical protein